MVTLLIKYPAHTRRVPMPKGEGFARREARKILASARLAGEHVRVTVVNSNERTMHKAGNTFSDMMAEWV